MFVETKAECTGLDRLRANPELENVGSKRYGEFDECRHVALDLCKLNAEKRTCDSSRESQQYLGSPTDLTLKERGIREIGDSL